MEKYGVPQWLYADWKNVCQRRPTEAEELAGTAPLTEFGRMCARLGTRIIGASSPQAKGRVERSNGTQPDRLIKKLRLHGIGTREEANRYLRQYYLPDHTRRFGREPASPQDYHRQTPSKAALDAAFRIERERVIRNDWVVQYEGRFLQVERESRYAPAGSQVIVSEGRDGGLQIRYRKRPVKWREIPRPTPRPEPCQKAKGHALEVRKKMHRPATNHPWKKWRPSWQQDQAAGPAVRAAL